jgi:hypothetical protein
MTPNYSNVGYIDTTAYYVSTGGYNYNVDGPYGYGVVNRPRDGNTMDTAGARSVMRAIGPLSSGGGGGGERHDNQRR